MEPIDYLENLEDIETRETASDDLLMRGFTQLEITNLITLIQLGHRDMALTTLTEKLSQYDGESGSHRHTG